MESTKLYNRAERQDIVTYPGNWIGYLNTVTERRAKVSSIRASETAHMLKAKQMLGRFIELQHSSVSNA